MAQVRAPMPASRRAKQFSMFDALKGFKEALAAKERQPESRRVLAQDAIEEINRTLCMLQPGDMVTVVYYNQHKGACCQITGTLLKNDSFLGDLHVANICVYYNDIVELYIESEHKK